MRKFLIRDGFKPDDHASLPTAAEQKAILAEVGYAKPYEEQTQKTNRYVFQICMVSDTTWSLVQQIMKIPEENAAENFKAAMAKWDGSLGSGKRKRSMKEPELKPPANIAPGFWTELFCNLEIGTRNILLRKVAKKVYSVPQAKAEAKEFKIIGHVAKYIAIQLGFNDWEDAVNKLPQDLLSMNTIRQLANVFKGVGLRSLKEKLEASAPVADTITALRAAIKEREKAKRADALYKVLFVYAVFT